MENYTDSDKLSLEAELIACLYNLTTNHATAGNTLSHCCLLSVSVPTVCGRRLSVDMRVPLQHTLNHKPGALCTLDLNHAWSRISPRHLVQT